MEIQAKIESVRQELNAENQRGALKDSSKVAELERQLNELIEQINPVVVEEVAEGSYFLDNVDADGINIKNLFINYSEENATMAYGVVRAIVQNEIMKLQVQERFKVEMLEQELEVLKQNEKSNQEDYDSMYELLVEKRTESNTLHLKLEDMTHKREAAANELAEAKTEIERLNSQVDDLRAEIAVGAKNATKLINVDVAESIENYKKSIKEAEKNKPVIYDVTPVDTRNSKFKAKFAETDEEFEDFYVYLKAGKYREVSADEAPTFRREEPQHTDADNQRDLVEESELTPPTFQSGEDYSSTAGLDEVNTSVEVATKSVEERLQALELRVFGQVEVAA